MIPIAPRRIPREVRVPRGAVVDPQHPINRDLCALYTFPEGAGRRTHGLFRRNALTLGDDPATTKVSHAPRGLLCAGGATGAQCAYADHAGELQIGTGDFSLLCWLRMTATPAIIAGPCGWLDTNGAPGAAIEQYAANCAFYCGGTEINGSVNRADGNLHMLCGTRKGSALTYYEDGKQVATGTNSNSVTPNSGRTLTIGHWSNNSPTTQFSFAGAVYQVRVYRGRALAAREVQELWTDRNLGLRFPGDDLFAVLPQQAQAGRSLHQFRMRV